AGEFVVAASKLLVTVCASNWSPVTQRSAAAKTYMFVAFIEVKVILHPGVERSGARRPSNPKARRARYASCPSIGARLVHAKPRRTLIPSLLLAQLGLI